ncbi:hypothetical protein EJ08DRAFT_586952 [Tothia fuscella]|uniref:Uncharacterized protein n=1 Tax=Tothia fuscella TaxID=1048955 RepID=A0A9P4NSW7_9PEZI|nr:hypothetical protein EJ08DRAFT_586952 [Tothia fuscella]
MRERNKRREPYKDRDPYTGEEDGINSILERLRKWEVACQAGLFSRLTSGQRHKKPSDAELERLALHYFPARGDLRVRIVDYGNGFARTHEATTLGQLEQFIKNKPNDIDVRWIHVPLGPGIALSSVEDLFLNEGGVERRNASIVGASHSWPYQEVEVLNLRHRDEYKAMRDVFAMLSKKDNNAANLRFQARLDKASESSMSDSLVQDLIWRAKHLDEKFGYWDLVCSDIPYHLTQVPAMETAHGPKDGPKALNAQHVQQTLWNHKFYENAQLVRNKLRCFHRHDGVLLTMAPVSGIDYLDKDLNTYLNYSKQKREDSEDASVLGFLFERFAQTGTKDWPEKTVEWLLTYILTEAAAAPHTIRQGRNAVTITSAYQAVVERLKMRRYEEFRRNESVKLVKEYLTCTDELTSICMLLHGKAVNLKQLLENVQKDDEDFSTRAGARRMSRQTSGRGSTPVVVPPGSCETMKDRIVWALGLVEDQNKTFQSLKEDLRLATEALFQLRSIEQNELAIVADSQNKAILVFTGVTIVFLPLSFFTSYFGMNLKGIQSTDRDEHWFWTVCGSIAFVIILISMLYAFRKFLRARWERANTREYSPV